MKIASLYHLIKEISQQKGRKLKIFCNINDVIRPIKVWATYGVSEQNIPFKRYFKIFWEKRTYEDVSNLQGTDANKQMIEKDIKKFNDYQKKRADLRKTITNKAEYVRKTADLEKEYMKGWNYLSNRPFTTIAEDLLKCLKEGNLLEELIFGIASWTKRKRNLPSILNTVRIEEFNESFKKFPESFFINGDNEQIPDYWERAITIRPDFDIWILTLDPGNIDKKSFENIYNNLGSDKIYILPNYACNRYLSTLKNVHLVKTEISDLQNKDFKFITNEPEQKNPYLSKNAIIAIFCAGFISGTIILYRVYWIIKKKKFERDCKINHLLLSQHNCNI